MSAAPPIDDYPGALARLPPGALAPELAQAWLRLLRERPELARDSPQVLAGTLGVLQGLGLDADTQAAALLHVAGDAGARLRQAGVAVPERLAPLLEGQQAAIQVWALHRAQGAGRNPEGMRRLLLAIVRDLRLVPVLLARHVARLRARADADDDEARALAQLARDIHAPLANRLGIWQLKWELEDLSFRVLQRQEYQHIAALLEESRRGREAYIAYALDVLKTTLRDAGIQAEVNGRPKHIFSIYRKMQRKGAPIGELYDLRALRVLVDDVADCYAALGVVHALWTPIPSEFDDYIARPKPNGYRSLHTAVVGPEHKALEVQIRTRQMHAQAELGVAAHWRYKEGSGADAAMDRRIAWMRQLLERGAEEGEAAAMDGLDDELAEERIYVLTPRGEVIDLPQGATPLDFAYHVHTEVGHRCRGAKVDGRIVPLEHRLRSGDRVEIMTAKSGEPRRDWLQASSGFLASARSREKVRSWFHKLDRARNTQAGRELLERELRKQGLLQADLQPVLGRFGVGTPEELYVLVALGDVGPNQVSRTLQELQRPQQPAATPPPARPARAPAQTGKTVPGGLTVHGIGNLLVQVARCCQPVAGEAVAGYLTRTRGVSVHRLDCAAYRRLAEREPERVLAVEWGADGGQQEVALRIDALDSRDLLKDITGLMAQQAIHVLGLHSEGDGRGRTRLQLRVRIGGHAQLSDLLERLRALRGVQSARRA